MLTEHRRAYIISSGYKLSECKIQHQILTITFNSKDYRLTEFQSKNLSHHQQEETSGLEIELNYKKTRLHGNKLCSLVAKFQGRVPDIIRFFFNLHLHSLTKKRFLIDFADCQSLKGVELELYIFVGNLEHGHLFIKKNWEKAEGVWMLG